MLKRGGILLIVGLAKPATLLDSLIEVGRLLPVKIGDVVHGVSGWKGMPVADAEETMNDIRHIVKKELPQAKLRQALYYRYLLSWTKEEE